MTTPAEKLDLRSLNITDEKHARLKELFPEVFTEGGKIDFDRLKLALGETVDVGKERYGMVWPGKADCFKTIQRPSIATLLPAKEESVEFDSSDDLFIEGDNLEVLKLLQKSYFSKIKLIYIDPPYNTGNEFIYPDDYSETLDTYLRFTGQIDDEGRKYSTNTEADGRFHSKWLSMIYARLYLARNLMSPEGVIFISIGEEELANLEKVCNELFGEENQISIIARVAKTASDMGSFFAPSIDFVLCYAKDKSALKPFQDEVDESLYKKTELKGSREGEKYRDDVALYQSSLTLERSRNARYYIECPDGSKCIPPEEKRWRIIEPSFVKMKDADQVVFKKTKKSPLLDENGQRSKWNIYTKSYLKDRLEEGTLPRNFLDNFINRKGADLIKKYGIEFEFSKPIELMGYFLDIVSLDKDDIVMDFFAGSASTAQSVMLKNLKHQMNLRYIMVQLPEPLEEKIRQANKGLETVADIGKERLRRVIKDLESNLQQLDFSGPRTRLGFKVFKLGASNFHIWDAPNQNDVADLLPKLDLHRESVRAGLPSEAILYEVLLKSGFPLTTRMDSLILAAKKVYSVADGAMLICFDDVLTQEVLKAIADRQPQRVVCLDEGFAGNDQLKTNTVQLMKSKGIVFRTV